ncbi:TPA: hypothetical protein ACT5CG_006790, partial [Burkholderia cenocepacia]
ATEHPCIDAEQDRDRDQQARNDLRQVVGHGVVMFPRYSRLNSPHNVPTGRPRPGTTPSLPSI